MHRGVRFAPSPTGRFHLGNLRTAWISNEWARALKEPWVVRFEDIDTPRVVPGAADQQLADLEKLGLVADEVIFQSARRIRHWELFRRGAGEKALYPCICSRKEVQEALAGLASAPHGALSVYSGHCRNEPSVDARPAGGVAWRFRSSDPSGTQDFIVARTTTSEGDEVSFVPAYHWACAIDDFDGHYSLLVRAADLATSTPLQREIQSWIGTGENPDWNPPAVFHSSLLVQDDGSRLEKRTRGVTLPEVIAAGWSPDRIQKLFQQSFQVDVRDYQPGNIFGEKNTTLTLLQLGFTSK